MIMNRENRIRWSITGAYAMVMLLVGALAEWRAPLRYDEWRFYLPTIRFFADSLPAVPLEYGPLNAPPLALILQGLAYSLTGSVAFVRALATLSIIAAVAVVTHLLSGIEGRSARILPLMIGSFPSFSLNAYTLKHYDFEVLFLALGFLAFLRGRHVAAALAFAAAALTRESALAFVAALGVEPLIRYLRRRDRESLFDLASLAAPVMAIAALFVYWHGTEPPQFRLTSTYLGLSRYKSPFAPVWQSVLALFMLGAWVVPSLDGWWRRWRFMAAAFPIAMIAVYRSELLLAHDVDREPFLYSRLIGPLSSVLFHVFATQWPRVIVAALFVAAGASTITWWRGRSAPAMTYAGIYIAMMAVVFAVFYEHYYAELVAGCWLLLRREIAESTSPLVHLFQAAVVLAGAGYLIIGTAAG